MRLKSILQQPALVALSFIAAVSAHGAERLWNVAAPTEADFNDGANWNPTFVGAWPSADGASIANGGTAVISADATLTQLVVGGFQVGTVTGTGAAKQTGGALTLTDGIVVGRQGTSVGTFDVTGGTITAVNLRVGGGSFTSQGTMTLSGAGTVLTTTQSGNGVVAIGTPGTGTMTVSNSAVWNHTGTIALEVGGDNNSINQNGGNGTLNIQSGATVALATANMSIGVNPASQGTVVVDGGSSLILSGATAAINIGTVFANVGRNGGTGTLTLNNGTIVASKINIATGTNINPGTGTGTVNFNGGTATIGGMTKGSGTGTVHFNGTIVQASAASADFYSGFSTTDLDIQAGGHKFDTNGNAVTITQGMSGVGGLTKLGAGSLTLSGVNTYAGATTIQAGTLQLGVSNAIASTSNLVLSSGTLALNGFNDTAGTLALTASSTLDFGLLAGANSLTLSNSSGLAWTGSLTLQNFEVGVDTLSFATASGLTQAQLGAISVPGYEAVGLDGNGVVQFSAVPEPSTLLLGLVGGLGLLGWHRFRKSAIHG